MHTNRQEVAPGTPTAPSSIREAGYHTACIGKMHLWRYGSTATVTTEMAPRMDGFGFTESHEVAGKVASLRVSDGYTAWLADRGWLDAYRDAMRETIPPGFGGEGAPLTTEQYVHHYLRPRPAPLPDDAHVDLWVGDRAARWIEEYERDEPFFLQVGFPGPHSPFDAPASYTERYARFEIVLDSLERPVVPPGLERFAGSPPFTRTDEGQVTPALIAAMRRSYYGAVTMIDDAIERILSALDRSGRAADTWVVYSSDHGEMLGTHGQFAKTCFYEPSVRIPLIVAPPVGAPDARRGHRVSGLVDLHDLVATFMEWCGASAPPGAEGASLTATLQGDRDHRHEVFSQNLGLAMLRTERHKLVLHEASRIPLQLFDLEVDPLEDVNLVGDPAVSSVIGEMLERASAVLDRPAGSTPSRLRGPA